MPTGNGNGYAADAKLIQDFMRRQELHNAQMLKELKDLRDDFQARMTRLETQRSFAVAAIGVISGVIGIALGAGLKRMLGL
jgi:hypothetical protein